MRTKHAPGPWKTDEECDIRSADGDWVACAYAERDDERRADALLIAAAPDMLAALNAMVRATDTIHPGHVNVNLYSAYQIAVAAIAKAEGKAV